MDTPPAGLSVRARIGAFAAVVVLAAGGAAVYVARQASDRSAAERAAARVDQTRRRLDPAAVRRVPHLVFRSTALGSTYNHVVLVPLADPTGGLAVTSTVCERVYAVASAGMCLSADRGVVTTYRASVLDANLAPVRDVPITGGPSRTRLSADGRLGATTVFVTGHSYTSTSFSTATQVVVTATGASMGNLETFRIVKDGRTYRNADINFWGVTFAADDNTFYATLATGGQTYLVRGDLRRRQVVTLRRNVECPSLSPDGTRIAFKKAQGSYTGRHWRFTVLDLASGTETALPETRNIDDQLAWLDNCHLMYAVPRGTSGASDIWVSPISGGSPKVLVPNGESPAAVPGSAAGS